MRFRTRTLKSLWHLILMHMLSPPKIYQLQVINYYDNEGNNRFSHLACMRTPQWKPQFISSPSSQSLPLSREGWGEEIPGEGAASRCSLPAGTDRPHSSACLQISYHDGICLAAWLNAHLLTRIHLRVCVCVCILCVRASVLSVLTSSISWRLEWRRRLYLPPWDYKQIDRLTFTTHTRYLII